MKRNEVPQWAKWQLEHICATPEEALERLGALNGGIDELAALKGSLNDDEAILSVLKKYYAVLEELYEIYSYASFRLSEDNGNSEAQQLAQRCTNTAVRFDAACSWIIPELTKKPASTLKRIAADPRFEDYSVMLEQIIRQKKHILGANEEYLLSLTGDFSSKFSDAFGMLSDVELPFPKVRDEKGSRVQLTHARFRTMLESSDRSVRRGAFRAMYSTYGEFKNTFASLYGASVNKDIFYARARKYPSALEASLDDDNVPKSVYLKLIEAVHEALPVLDEYCALRRRALGVEKLHMYDLYAPLVANDDFRFTPDEAKAMVREALGVLGEDYVALLDEAYNGGWMDLFENEGKTSGAFCGSTYRVHPYVLLNFDGKLDDVFTMAHELGHAMHSHYSNTTQPFPKADYKIFVAEVASTVNEILLTRHLLSVEKDPARRAYILNHYLEQFRTTVIRQTMFAEFEMLAHEAAEKGEPLNYETLCKTYLDLNKLYYGREVSVDKAISFEWSRIPHFYNAFYVYKYATGFSAASAIAERILNGGEKELAEYKRFLSGGGSDYPMELLKLTGVDLSTNEPVRACMRTFKAMLDELKSLI